ncbi:MAG: alpha/beta hydrolase [Chthoniobacter sp.]|uniref:alpha/beta hydrolase n=1 Tax=Chthoniobacter sp. TaxID=2510640 RepID=UPI0032AC3B57
MIFPRVLSLLCLFIVGSVCAADRPTEPLRLWTGQAPDALGDAAKDTPTLTPYWPAADQASGAAFIVCPGGGYRNLAAHEGEPFAKWLVSQGIAAFVLKYRLTTDGYHVPTALLDATRAMRLVRSHAADWGIDPKRIGMIGSSAGGHLTATLITQFDAGKADDVDPIERVSSRPDLAVLCYGFILFDIPDAERQERFLGSSGTPELTKLLSPRLNVRKDTPTTFIWQTVEDEKVIVDNAFAFAAALREKGVPFDLHLYQKGKHGIGLGDKNLDPAKMHPWTKDCAFWLKQQGFAK